MDSKKLEVLLAAVDFGSFSKASEAIGYTQSGITHMMDSLEKELGFKILDRSHSGVRLTKNGQQLMPAIRDFLSEKAVLDDLIKQLNEKKEDTIRVAAYSSIAINWLPEILYQFRAECPDTDVDLRMVDNAVEPYELLIQGSMDIIFVSRQDAGVYDWIPLYNEPMYAVIPPDYPIKSDRYFDISDFDKQDFLMPYGRFELDVEKALRLENVNPRVIPALVDDAAVIKMVEHGLGLSIMTELMLRGRNENVRCIPLYPTFVRELGMAVRNIKLMSDSVKKLTDCTKRHLKIPDFSGVIL